jgi:Na+/glutamate symporter
MILQIGGAQLNHHYPSDFLHPLKLPQAVAGGIYFVMIYYFVQCKF